MSSDSDSFHSPPDAYGTHALGDLNEAKPVIDFAAGPVNPAGMSGGGDGASSSEAFRVDSNVPFMSGSEPVQVRRLSMPASTRPSLGFQHRGLHLKQQSMPVHGPSGLSAPLSATYPMPLHANTLQIADTNMRTGMHGDHPPNMGFSPSGALGNLWITEDAAKSQDQSDLLLRGTSDAPSFRIDDASTWARRGFGTLGDGLRPTEPAPLNPGSIPNSFQFGFTSMVGQVGNAPGQVNFQSGLSGVAMQQQPPLLAPAGKIDGNAPAPQAPLGSSPIPPLQLSPTSATGMTAPTSSTAPDAPSTPQPQPSAASATGASSVAQTVSPGVYQSGFSMPPPVTGHWISPRGTPSPTNLNRGSSSNSSATATKTERRMSLSHPYSPPRARQPALPLPASNLRQVGGSTRRESGQHQLTINTAAASAESDDGLPSASLAQPELFGGELDKSKPTSDVE